MRGKGTVRVALGVALACGLYAADAAAPPHGALLRLATRSPVPANGALVFEPQVWAEGEAVLGEGEEVSVAVVGPGGPVAGVLSVASGLLVWTPERELALGGHTVEVACTNPYLCFGFSPVPFEVVAARVLAAPVVTCDLTLAPATGNGTEQACCSDWEESSLSEPRCFALTLNTNHVGYAAAGCHVELSGAEPGDVLYRATEPALEGSSTGHYYSLIWIGTSWFRSLQGSEITLTGGDWAVPLAAATEYCLTVELMDTRTGIPSEVRHCVPDPGWEPVEIPAEFAGSNQLYSSICEVPPPGFEDAWCSQNRSSHAERCLAQDAASMDRPAFCAAYEGLCPDRPLPPVLADNPEPAPVRLPADGGCGCRAGAGFDRSGAVAPVGWVMLLGLLALRWRRRRR